MILLNQVDYLNLPALALFEDQAPNGLDSFKVEPFFLLLAFPLDRQRVTKGGSHKSLFGSLAEHWCKSERMEGGGPVCRPLPQNRD